MAKRRTPAAPPPPTPERVARAARAGDFAAAVETARELHALTPTPETLALRKRTLADAAAHFADRDRAADFNRVVTEAGQLDPDDPAWAVERAALLARGGRLSEALALGGEANRAKVLGHAADRAVRVQSRAFLPDDLHAGFDAVLAAFRHHEAGDEPAAREALEPIGLRSPFLEWKVLLRGLLAHAAGDDLRASENFGRLDPARLPARLAAPLRIAVDPAYKAALPAETASALTARLHTLTTSPAVDLLRAIARDLGRDKPLSPAFRSAEAVLPHLKKDLPHLAPRLANCLYHAIANQGQPDDLARYRKLFGNPPDDPQFHKLQAMIYEQVGDPTQVHAHWQKYEAWLAGNPAGWPPAVAARARAVVWTHLGANARQAEEEPEDDELMGYFAPPRKRKKPKPLDPPPEVCFTRAAELAPDWPDAARYQFAALVDARKPADAEAAVRAFLGRHPEDLPTLTALAGLLRGQGRAEEAAELWLRALAVNPLDKPTRSQAAMAVLAEARFRLTKGDATAADAVFERHRPLLEDTMPAARHALRAVVLTKLGKADEAAAARDAALAVPGSRLGVAYRMMVDAQLAKLKPADKRAFDKLFADELAKPPAPMEVVQLVGAHGGYHVEGVNYRGQKTHEKKVLDQVARCVGAEAPELDFERLAELLTVKREWKLLKKYADACVARFPGNPVFALARCEAGFGTNEREYYLEQRLRRAKQLAEASAEPRHRALAERIEELLKEIASPFDVLESLFGRR